MQPTLRLCYIQNNTTPLRPRLLLVLLPPAVGATARHSSLLLLLVAVNSLL